MARPNREAIETFISITGVPESVALQKLEEHSGDLNEAVNAHFSEGDQNSAREAQVAAPPGDFMEIDDPIGTLPTDPLFPTRTGNPFSILDQHLRPSLLGLGSDPLSRGPFVTQPREVREVPIEFKDGSEPLGRSSNAPTIEDVTDTAHGNDPGAHGAVTLKDDDNEDMSPAPGARNRSWAEQNQDGVGDTSHYEVAKPSAPVYDAFPDYHNEIEEEMVRAAIEASKRDVEGKGDHATGKRQLHVVDADLEHAVNMSLKTAEEEKRLHGSAPKIGALETEASEATNVGHQKVETSNGRVEAGSSSFLDEGEDVEEQPLVRHNSRRVGSGSSESNVDDRGTDVGLPSNPREPREASHQPSNGNAFPSDEWFGISSEEHDEAVMLEAAMFGGIPETGYRSGYGPHQHVHSAVPYAHPIPRVPSPSLQAQRMIREQQDDEYLASLQADQEKEMKAMREAEARRLEEEAAKRAALEAERQKEEEARRKMEEEQELERQLAAKEASLPKEPAADEENAINLLVKMPDGSRRSRRFLKSDKLQSLFDFIDIGRTVKPGTYRVVRPFPRRPFSDGESDLSLSELGLTSKQEALFLELI